MDTSVLQVEWLEDKHVKLEVVGLSAASRKVCKNLVIWIKKSNDCVAS
jgi:hypothetical protein